MKKIATVFFVISFIAAMFAVNNTYAYQTNQTAFILAVDEIPDHHNDEDECCKDKKEGECCKEQKEVKSNCKHKKCCDHSKTKSNNKENCEKKVDNNKDEI